MNEFVFAPSYRDLWRGCCMSIICLLIQFSFKSTTETSECKAHATDEGTWTLSRGNEGKLRSHSSFQKSAPMGPAGPQVSHRAPQTTMAMCYVCVMSALLPNIYPSNAVYVELANLSYCRCILVLLFLPSVVSWWLKAQKSIIIIIIKNEKMRVAQCENTVGKLYIVNAYAKRVIS